MNKFNLGPIISYDKAIEDIAEQINLLWEKVDDNANKDKVRESLAKIAQMSQSCTCDADYTGEHTKRCIMYGTRVPNRGSI